MKIVFMGTPEIAAYCLDKLATSEHEIVCVVTGLDKKIGRGQKIAYSPVKEIAIKHNFPIFQFQSIRKEGVEVLKSFNADIFITLAFGQILSAEILNIAKYGTINAHVSLLPKLRGAAPINWSIINGDKLTGITIMQTFPGIDDGDILKVKEITINESENASELTEKIKFEIPELLLQVLGEIENGTVVKIPQNHALATAAPMIYKETCKINFSKKACDVVNLVRGLADAIVAFCHYNDQEIKVYKARRASFDNQTKHKPGEIVVSNSKQGLIVACKDGEFVEILDLQAINSKRMTAKSYLCGKKLEVGECLQ